jgi:predicted MPP superfamily phosphohydrolase
MPGQAERQPRLSRRTFLKLGCGALLGGAATCLLGPIYVTQVEPDWIEVTRVDIPLSGLPEALEGFTIAQLGDFHLGQQVSVEDVRRSVKIANGLGPDLIVLTGDFVTSWAGYSSACAQELAALEAQYGVYAVLGNHDIWTDAEEVAANVAGVGIALLRNERQALEVGDTQLWLLGIEDTGYTGYTGGFFAAGASSFGDFRAMWQDTKDALANLLEGIPPDEPRLLLVHNPDFTEMLPEGRIDLALCGHTHGGQVRLPFLGELVTPSCLGQKYARGLVQGPSTLVYVNRGIGLISPAVRFNCRPEVTLLSLSRG